MNIKNWTRIRTWISNSQFWDVIHFISTHPSSQYMVFPSSHPYMYWPGSKLPNFGNHVRISVSTRYACKDSDILGEGLNPVVNWNKKADFMSWIFCVLKHESDCCHLLLTSANTCGCVRINYYHNLKYIRIGDHSFVLKFTAFRLSCLTLR